jgi:hypothetical protein
MAIPPLIDSLILLYIYPAVNKKVRCGGLFLLWVFNVVIVVFMIFFLAFEIRFHIRNLKGGHVGQSITFGVIGGCRGQQFVECIEGH